MYVYVCVFVFFHMFKNYILSFSPNMSSFQHFETKIDLGLIITGSPNDEMVNKNYSIF